MVTVAEKKSSIEQKKQNSPPSAGKRFGNFFTSLLGIVVVMLVSYAISPPLFYAIQFLNDNVIKESFKYGDFNDLQSYSKTVVKRSPVLFGQKDLSEYLSEGFHLGVADSFFSARDMISKMLAFFRRFLGLPENINLATSTQEDIAKLRETKGTFAGALIIGLTIPIYMAMFTIPHIVSSVSACIAFLKHQGSRNLIKLGLLFFIPFLFWWIFFIPPMLSILVFMLLFGGLLTVFMLSSTFNTARVWGGVVSAISWLPKWLNSMIKKQTGRQGNVPEGVKTEYMLYAGEYRKLYVGFFTVMSILALISAFV